jgi:hypothetical protein
VLRALVFAAVFGEIAGNRVVDEEHAFEIFLLRKRREIGGAPEHRVGNPEKAAVFPGVPPLPVDTVSPFASRGVHQIQPGDIGAAKILKALRRLKIRQTAAAGLPFSRHPQALRGVAEGQELLGRKAFHFPTPHSLKLVRKGIPQAGINHGETRHAID